MPSTALQEALDYLYGLTANGIKLGLDTTRQLLRHFGDPHLKTRTIHIAGTNGKGSTAAFTDSILRAAGKRTGLFTSPHLLNFNERIRVDGVPIPEARLVHHLSRIREAAETLDLPVTFFECGTVLAFLHFLDCKTEWNVVEVGMGGRLDATNLCEAEIAIITSIGRDHTAQLGEDLKQIAYEKACIIKPRSTVFTHVEDESAFGVIQEMAAQKKATLKHFGADFNARSRSRSLRGQTIDYSNETIQLNDVTVPLAGSHQVSNAALALSACLHALGADAKQDALRRGLAATRWEGRLEVVRENPTVLLDCAHNPDGMRTLVQTVRECVPHSRCVVVLGLMRDKEHAEMLKILSPIVDHLILTRPSQERSEAPERIQTLLSDWQKPIDIAEQIPYALKIARDIAMPNDLLCVTGSIFTVSEAKAFFADEAFH